MFFSQTMSAIRMTLRALCILALLAFGFCTPSHGQDLKPGGVQRSDLPRFHLDVLSFSSPDSGKSRLDCYLQMPYAMVSFVKVGDAFQASYEASIAVHNSSGQVVAEKLWTEKLESRKYEETIARHSGKISQRSFLLPPGNYTITAQARDTETKKISQVDRAFVIRDYTTASFALSDLLAVNQMSVDSGKTSIVPNVSGQLPEGARDMTIFFEAYDKLTSDSARFTLTVANARRDVVQTDTMHRSLPDEKNSCFMTFHTDKLPAGEYQVTVRSVPVPSEPGGDISFAEASRPFSIRMRGLPPTITDLDIAIDQLQYLNDKEEIEELKKSDPATKREMFLNFWKRRDPTPSTEFNELMDEYYRRIEFANKNFSHYLEGWKTDRGMVFVIFGEPNNIERRPFEIDSKPYEVWTYYELNREFVFIDASGFGDYRLQNPMWDTWRTRYR